MIRLKIMCEESGDTVQITCTTRDIARWEKTTKGATFASLQADMKVVDLYKIGWFALQRHGLLADQFASLAEFEKGADLDVLDDEDDEPDPTPSAV